MYSQYQQYQQQGGAVVASHQNGMTWNGRSWVATSHVNQSSSSTTSTYTGTSVSVSQPSTSAIHPVTLYTQYYHDWKAREAAEEERARTLTGAAKQEAQSHAAWARYYADQSSRAAHYFHNPSGTAPPELPPAPPTSASVTKIDREPQATQQGASGGLKEYVHRCLVRCQNQDELQKMQEQVQSMISKALKDGTMHTTNWDTIPLLPMPSNSEIIPKFSTSSSKDPAKSPVTTIRDAGHYGPSAIENPNHSVDEIASKSNLTSCHMDLSHYRKKKIENKQSSPSHIRTTQISTKDYSYYGNSSAANNQLSSKGKEKVLARDYSYYGNSIVDSQEASVSASELFERNSSKAEDTSSICSNSNSKLDLSDDFISIPNTQSKRQQKRARKTLQKQESDLLKRKEATDGFERSNSTLSKRANRFSVSGDSDEKTSSYCLPENHFDKYMGKELIGGSKKLGEHDFEKMKVKGTCQILEKEYLRLTAPPKAERVRPQPVLELHLQNLMEERSRMDRRDYAWFCSQLKAIRQDLTVQQIVNAFAVRVYEAHARVSLEEKDLNEYNQCQTQLKELYSRLKDDMVALENVNEFIAYRILYYSFLTGNKKYDGGSGDFLKIMLTLSSKQLTDPCISHALQVRLAVTDFDYHSFFRLQRTCPNKWMVYLMQFITPYIRQWSLQRICKAYRPNIDVAFVLAELGFSADELELGTRWLESCGCVLSTDRLIWETKETTVRESDWKEQNSLI
jgi:hypothetical protein